MAGDQRRASSYFTTTDALLSLPSGRGRDHRQTEKLLIANNNLMFHGVSFHPTSKK